MNSALGLSFPADGALGSIAWYALKVRTRSEDLAATVLRNKGFELFAPVCKERRKYSDRIKWVPVAAFPGYIFCRFNTQKKVPILSSPAVEYIVGMAGAPVPITDSEIEGIRRVVDAGGTPVPYLAIGQLVRVECGPLAGVEGFLIRIGKENRLTLSVHLLQRSVCVTVDADHVRVL